VQRAGLNAFQASAFSRLRAFSPTCVSCQLFLLFTFSPAARRANFLPPPHSLLDGIEVTLKKQRADFQKQLGVSPKTARRFQKTPRCFT
jgi:hypothetical protein